MVISEIKSLMMWTVGDNLESMSDHAQSWTVSSVVGNNISFNHMSYNDQEDKISFQRKYGCYPTFLKLHSENIDQDNVNF